MRLSTVVRLVVVVGFVAFSCSSRSHPLPSSPDRVDVTMEEYRFDHPKEIAEGRVVFRARNVGTRPHQLALVILDEDLPPIQQLVRSATRRAVPTMAFLPQRQPGRVGTFAVDLTPGRYGLVCFIADADGVNHAAKGMSSELRVRSRK